MIRALLVAGLLLASLGEFNARHHRERRPRHQRVRPRLAKEEPPQRRTFITALLAAEVAYLEGLLADQHQGGKQPGKHQQGKGGNAVHHSHKHKPVHHAGPYHAAPTKPVKYVSKLDPFYMIAAPDLTKESPKSYDAPAASAASEAPGVTSTTAKYGELEHYNLGGYLPPPAAQAPQYEEPSYAPPPNSYQIATTTTAPPPTTTNNYKPPVNSYVNVAPPAPTYQKPAPPPAYEPAPAPPSYSQPAPAPPSYPGTKLVLIPSYPSPSYPAPQASYNQHPHTFFHEAQAAKVHDKSDNGATEVTDSVGSSSGEFPTIFYNNIGGSSKNTLIL